MSDPYESTTPLDASAKDTQADKAIFRAIAPRPIGKVAKLRAPIRPLIPIMYRRRPPGGDPGCPVCLRAGCRLSSHQAFWAWSQQIEPNLFKNLSLSNITNVSRFNSSYAYAIGQQYVDRDIASDRIDPFYKFPVKAQFDTPEMHRLFHTWFKFEAPSNLLIPCPASIKGDPISTPFLLPALQDSALCLAILTIAATTIPLRTGNPARNIVSLTLIGEAMQQMRERIDSDGKNILDTTIMAAVILWAVNAYFGDTDAMKSHASSVTSFVHARGGIHNLGMVGTVANAIRWIDVLNSVIFLQPCQFLDRSNPSNARSPPPHLYGDFWKSPTMPYATYIDAELIACCQDTCRLVELLEQVEQTEITATEHKYLFDKLSWILTHEAGLRAKYRGSGTLNECICMASCLVKTRLFYGGGHIRILYPEVAVFLVKAIKATGGPSFWRTDVSILIWLLFVIVMTPDDFDDKDWCSELLCQVIATKFGIEETWPSDWKRDINRCLRSFVWSDLRFSGFFDEVCTTIADAQGIVSETETNHEFEPDQETRQGKGIKVME